MVRVFSLYFIDLLTWFYGHSQTNISSATRHCLWTQPVSIVSIPHVNQREQLASASVSWLHGADSVMKNGRKKHLRAQRRTKWMAVIILQCSLSLSDVHTLSTSTSTSLHSILSPLSPSAPSPHHQLFLFSLLSHSVLSSYLTTSSLLPPQYGGCCSVPVTPSGFTLSLPLTPFILWPPLSPIITGCMDLPINYTLKSDMSKV